MNKIFFLLVNLALQSFKKYAALPHYDYVHYQYVMVIVVEGM